MPRIRTIKPETPQSESMARISREARLLFILMWTLSDDAGRLRASSRLLASLLYPFDDDASDLMDGWLSELEREKCIVRYEVDGTTYAEIVNWLEHQKIDRPSKSKIPAFDEASRVVAKPREGSSGDQGPKDQGPKDHTRSARRYAFQGKVIKLNREDFDAWQQANPYVELQSYLVARDAFLAEQPEADRKRWFMSTTADLRNKNLTAKQQQQQGQGPPKRDEAFGVGVEDLN